MAQAKTFAAKALALHKKKNFIQAEIEWKNALKLYADGEMYYRFGDTLFNLSRFEDAVKSYKNAIELNHPEKKYVYYNMACAYSKMKDKNNGLEYLRLAIQNGYNAYDNIKGDSDLAYLRQHVNINKFIPESLNANGFLDEQLIKAINDSNQEMVKKLLKQGVNPNNIRVVDDVPSTALMIAAKKGNIEIINLLLENGAKINQYMSIGAAGPFFVSSLFTAVKHNRIEVVKLLIKKGFNVSELGFTPLIQAIVLKNIKMARFFLEKGADPNRIQYECCAIAEKTPLMAAISNGLTEVVNLLLSRNVDVNYVNVDKDSALTYAIGAKNFILAVELIKRGAKVKNRIIEGLHSGEYFGHSLLMYAICFCPEIVPLLIQKGADIHYKKPNCTENCTALQVAKKRGLQNIVKLLIQAGARE